MISAKCASHCPFPSAVRPLQAGPLPGVQGVRRQGQQLLVRVPQRPQRRQLRPSQSRRKFLGFSMVSSVDKDSSTQSIHRDRYTNTQTLRDRGEGIAFDVNIFLCIDLSFQRSHFYIAKTLMLCDEIHVYRIKSPAYFHFSGKMTCRRPVPHALPFRRCACLTRARTGVPAGSFRRCTCSSARVGRGSRGGRAKVSPPTSTVSDAGHRNRGLPAGTAGSSCGSSC